MEVGDFIVVPIGGLCGYVTDILYDDFDEAAACVFQDIEGRWISLDLSVDDLGWVH